MATIIKIINKETEFPLTFDKLEIGEAYVAKNAPNCPSIKIDSERSIYWEGECPIDINLWYEDPTEPVRRITAEITFKGE